ncbi:MAG: hypothetical protein HY586_03980 [Candidatus Omnitrophica bacterium]|nr:hypothetical protein [Candidatus Omnitrophota bacterium]
MIDFQIIGHRGVPKLTPENSASGFKLAVALGIPMIELDVRLTRDKELVVIHNNDIKKYSDGKGKVTQCDFRYLRQFDYGSYFDPRFRGEKILKLEEALDILLPRVRVMVEIKEDKIRRKEMADVLLQILEKKKQMLDKIIICSFSDKQLIEIQKRDPTIWLGLIARTKPKSSFEKACYLGFRSIHPHHRIASASLIKWAKAQGMYVFIWTVNSLKNVRHWKAREIDGIITDIPSRLIQEPN